MTSECEQTRVLHAAAQALKKGGAVVFPTDTVYGLGVAVDFCANPSVLFRLKGRAENKPVAWLVDGVSCLEVYGKDVPAWAREAARAQWPGALTLVVRASKKVPCAYQSAAGTIGLRMPASEIACALIRAVGCPLATTSANLSGKPAPSNNDELDEQLLCHVDAAVRGVNCTGGCGVASTVVDCTSARPVVLRQGAVVFGAPSN